MGLMKKLQLEQEQERNQEIEGRLIGDDGYDLRVYVQYRKGDKFYVTTGEGNNFGIQRDEYGDWRTTKANRLVTFSN